MGNKAGKVEATTENAMDSNTVSPMPEAPLAMMEIEKTPIGTPMHDMPPPPDEKWVAQNFHFIFFIYIFNKERVEN